MKVLAICGSIHSDSANLRLLQLAATMVGDDVEFEIFDGLAGLPFFRPDIEPNDVPQPVRDFRAALATSDAVLIASPEYGHSLPGVLKNAFDWVIGSGELYQKRVAVTASAPAVGRGERGLAAVCAVLRAVDARVIGGDPIVRGPDANEELAVLVDALVASARTSHAS